MLSEARDVIEVNNTRINLPAVPQLVKESQSKAITAVLDRLDQIPGPKSDFVAAYIKKLSHDTDEKALHGLNICSYLLEIFTQPWLFEISAEPNILRVLREYT